MGLRSFKCQVRCLSWGVRSMGRKHTHTLVRTWRWVTNGFESWWAKLLARSSKHKLPQRFLGLQNSRIFFLGWFSFVWTMYKQKLTYIQPINLLHHSSLNFLGNYYGFTLHHTSLNFLRNYYWLLHHSSLNFLGNLLRVGHLTPYFLEFPWKIVLVVGGAQIISLWVPWPIILLLLVLMDSKRSCPCTWPLSFLFFFFFPFFNFSFNF